MKPAETMRRSLPVFRPDFVEAVDEVSRNHAMRQAIDEAVVRRDAARRAILAEQLPDADALRQRAGEIKRHTLDHLDYYLQQLEANVRAHGGQVHYAAAAEEANELVIAIARAADVKSVVKSKSMVSEETELNHALESAGLKVLETDLGEFVVQAGEDHPSHLVLPIIHLKARQVGDVFAKYFNQPWTDDPQQLAEMARVYLREAFAQADMGISGANFAVAETGSIVLCTNEGNGRMCTSRPRIHVALMGMEKVIPRLQDLPVFLKLLARSATGQPLTQYTNIITGPRRPGELDGPEQFHLIVIDNGRSRILASEYRDALRCIRCGACLNACPIYRNVGGHSYGSVYPGPIGAILVPLFNGMERHRHLPHASSLCGACFEACPVKIDIPALLLQMRREMVRTGITSRGERFVFRLWSWALRCGWLYRMGQRLQRGLLRLRARDGWITRMPGPAKGWTQHRDFPAPAARSFRQLWRERSSTGEKEP